MTTVFTVFSLLPWDAVFIMSNASEIALAFVDNLLNFGRYLATEIGATGKSTTVAPRSAAPQFRIARLRRRAPGHIDGQLAVKGPPQADS